MEEQKPHSTQELVEIIDHDLRKGGWVEQDGERWRVNEAGLVALQSLVEQLEVYEGTLRRIEAMRPDRMTREDFAEALGIARNLAWKALNPSSEPGLGHSAIADHRLPGSEVSSQHSRLTQAEADQINLVREVRHVAGEVQGWRRDALLGLVKQLEAAQAALARTHEDQDEAMRYTAKLEEQFEILQSAAQEVETLAFRQYLDWMHFHEVAMAKPFEAETEAQDFARRVSSLLTIALGPDSTIEVVDSNPASEPRVELEFLPGALPPGDPAYKASNQESKPK